MRTYHEGLKPTRKTGTFYFGGNRNFLLWSDTRIEGTAPAPPPHRGRHASHATELPAARRTGFVPKRGFSRAAPLKRFSGFSPQGGVASIRPPNRARAAPF